MAFKIGSFNIQKFNFESDKDVKKNFEQIANIITSEQFDIVAIQEAIAKDAVKYLVGILGATNWTYSWESPPSFSERGKEGYAFVWNTKRFRLATKIDKYSGLVREIDPHVLNQYKHFYEADKKLRLIRPPYIGRFVPKHLDKCEFRLINTHIAFNLSTESGVTDISKWQMRLKEFQILTEGIYHKISNTPEGNMSFYTILLGDYNLNLPASGKSYRVAEVVEVNDNGTIQRIKTVQSELTTLKHKVDDDNPDAPIWSNNYDHFSYDEKLEKKASFIPRRINTVSGYCAGDYKLHRKEISDHVPIQLDVELTKI